MYLIGLETRWRPGGDSSLRDVSWRLAGSPGSHGKLKHVQFFYRHFPVSSSSRRGLRDISISCGDVAETNFVRDWGDVSETCWRLRRQCDDVSATLLDTAWPTLETMWLSGCWHHQDAFTHGLGCRPWRCLGQSASYFLVSQVAQIGATD